MRWLALVVLAMTAMPAGAQDAVIKGDNKCAYAGRTFSEGGLVRIGDRIFSCVARNWVASEAGTANCFYQDHFYGPGSLVSIKDVMLECRIDGTWEQAALKTASPARPSKPA